MEKLPNGRYTKEFREWKRKLYFREEMNMASHQKHYGGTLKVKMMGEALNVQR